MVSIEFVNVLDELGADDFKRFQWSLSHQVLDDCEPIPKSQLESADRQETVSKMKENYGEKSALNLAVEILSRMKRNNVADKLEKLIEELEEEEEEDSQFEDY